MAWPAITARGWRGGGIAAGPAAPAAETAQVTRQSDLLHWWKMVDETDSIGGATLTKDAGNPDFNDSEAPFAGAKSLALDGTDDRASGALDTAIETPFTWSGWIYIKDLINDPPIPVNLAQPVTFAETTTPSFVYHLGLVTYGNAGAANVRFAQGDGALKQGYISAGIPGNQWFFAAHAYDETEIRMYIAPQNGSDVWPADPTELNQSPIAHTTAWPVSGHGLDNVIFGDSFWSNHWLGNVSDVRLYDAALSELEIQDIYNGGAGDY